LLILWGTLAVVAMKAAHALKKDVRRAQIRDKQVRVDV